MSNKITKYDSDAWEDIELEKLYSSVGWSKNRLHTIKLLQKYSDEDFLDIGCLDGAYIKKLRELGYKGKYHGCDVTKRHIEVAKKNNPKETFTVDDARNLSFEDEQFPTVFFSDVIQHLSSHEAVIKEVSRVAEKYLIISTYGSHTNTFTRHNDKFLNTYFSKKDFEAILPEDFKVISFDDLPHPGLSEDHNIRIYHYVLKRK
jgi:ubiquinone/menaquinone biosynthesis C-methylase UbiE